MCIFPKERSSITDLCWTSGTSLYVPLQANGNKCSVCHLTYWREPFELMDVCSSMWVPHNLNLAMWNVTTLKLSGPAQRDTCTTSEPNMQYISKDGVGLTVFIPPLASAFTYSQSSLSNTSSEDTLCPNNEDLKLTGERDHLCYGLHICSSTRGNHLHTWKNRFPEPETSNTLSGICPGNLRCTLMPKTAMFCFILDT